MFEFLSIVCLAAALSQGSCVQQANGASGQQRSAPDSYEMRVAPGMYQLSYAASAHDYSVPGLVAHWRERAAQLCGGDHRGVPQSQIRYPDPGFDAITAFLSVETVRTYNVEVYGVAHCADDSR